MKLVTFMDPDAGTPRVGAWLSDDEVLDFAAVINEGTVLNWFDIDGPFFSLARNAFVNVSGHPENTARARERGALAHTSKIQLLPPVPRPGKLICIGLNYRDHAAESNMKIPERPVVFSKFTSCVIAPEEPIVLPATSSQVDYEAELAVVIGRRAKNVAKESALDYVLGYTCFNDVSARDFQFADGQWQRGKSCDTFGPMGPFIVTTDEVPDPQKLDIKLRLNGKTMQDSNTDQLIFGVRELIAFLSETITLEPGDLIATGTPAGVGFARKPPVYLQDGDVVEVEIEKVGTLKNKVLAAEKNVGRRVQSQG
jgi:2-keto-4-pentenoate hydratase/2-oxohepta-3-ene-1,7-dioic acid hydratase in catechol pathway